jgi:hypothetical protein
LRIQSALELVMRDIRQNDAMADGPLRTLRYRRALGGLLMALGVAMAASSATGQNYVGQPCEAGPSPTFEDHLQSLWYRRFWTGQCNDLPSFGCRQGKPYWNDVVRTLSARAPAAMRVEVATRACRLGRQIGFEWTRPRAERRIDTHDLGVFNTTLEQAHDVMAGLTAVEASVRAKIGH